MSARLLLLFSKISNIIHPPIGNKFWVTTKSNKQMVTPSGKRYVFKQ